MYDPAEFADKLEKWEENFWEVIDSWLLDKIAENDLGMVATSMINLARTSQRVGSKLLTGTAADLLRLGTFDPDDTSVWGITKGVGANALRLVSVVGPAGRAVGFAGRYAGLVAATKLTSIPGATAPCTFVAANNVITLLRGRTSQVFASLDDILRVRGANAGWFNSEVVKTAPVKAIFDKHGIFSKNVFGLQSVDDALNFARRADGPVTFGVTWTDGGRRVGHEIAAVKDPFGKLKILDYFEGKARGFRGYDTFEEFARSFNQTGRSITFDHGPVLQYSSQYMTALKMLDGAFVVAVPFVVGVRPNGVVFDIAQSVWNYLRRKLGDEAPPLPDLVTNPPNFTVSGPEIPPYWYTVHKGIPKEDWLSSRAGKHYGDMLLWPLIFEATQAEERKIGPVKFVNQNKMWEGQRVFVPDISGISADRRATAKERGRDWKRIG